MAPQTVDELLAEARSRIRRYEPAEAYQELCDGAALLVDTRSDGERGRDGIVPGSLHVPRSVLEWRLDLTGPWRNTYLDGVERRVILLCAHGYSSSLAAATLVELGWDAGDVTGGFEAWIQVGLPVAPAPVPPNGLPGSGPPDG